MILCREITFFFSIKRDFRAFYDEKFSVPSVPYLGRLWGISNMNILVKQDTLVILGNFKTYRDHRVT